MISFLKKKKKDMINVEVCDGSAVTVVREAVAGPCPLPLDTVRWIPAFAPPSIRLSVRPSLKVQLCLFLSFLVSKWQQMNYKSDQILLQERVCVCE